MRVAVCLPKNATFTIRYMLNGKRVTEVSVSSLAEISTDTTGGKYFFDNNRG